MSNILEKKCILTLMENLNSDLSYLIKTVLTKEFVETRGCCGCCGCCGCGCWYRSIFDFFNLHQNVVQRISNVTDVLFVVFN